MFGHGAQVRAVKRPSGTNWRPDGPSRLAGNAMAVLSTPFDPYYRKPMATLEDMRGQPMALTRDEMNERKLKFKYGSTIGRECMTLNPDATSSTWGTMSSMASRGVRGQEAGAAAANRRRARDIRLERTKPTIQLSNKQWDDVGARSTTTSKAGNDAVMAAIEVHNASPEKQTMGAQRLENKKRKQRLSATQWSFGDAASTWETTTPHITSLSVLRRAREARYADDEEAFN